MPVSLLIKKEFSDKKRNNYFIGNNWIVLRFAEEQIIRTPDSCGKFIAKVLNDFFQDFDMNVLDGIDDLTEVGIWSKKDAALMEKAIEEGCEQIHEDDWK